MGGDKELSLLAVESKPEPKLVPGPSDIGVTPRRVPIPDDQPVYTHGLPPISDHKQALGSGFFRRHPVRETRWLAHWWRIPIYFFLTGLVMLILNWYGVFSYLWSQVPRFHPTEYFVIQDLLVDASALPEGWQTHANGPRAFPATHYAIARTQLFFYSEGGVADEAIRRFPDEESLHAEYERQVAIWFPEGPFSPAWEVPAELATLESRAERVALGCTSAGMCHYLAVIEPYLVRFSATVGPELSYADYLAAIAQVEAHVDHYLAIVATDTSLLGQGPQPAP